MIVHFALGLRESGRAFREHRTNVGVLPISHLSLKERPRLPFPAAIERYICSLQARSFLSSKGGLVDPRLRASNEALLRARVPRAGGRPGYPSRSFFDNSVGICTMGQLFIPDCILVFIHSAHFIVSRAHEWAITLTLGGGCFSRIIYVNNADDHASPLCPGNAGLSPVQGDGLGIQRRVLDLRDLWHRDYATGPLTRDPREAVSS